MRFSSYNIWVNDYPRPGTHLLFNCRTQSLTEVTDELRRALERFCVSGDMQAGALTAEDLGDLQEKGVLVDDDLQERTLVEDLLRRDHDVPACEVLEVTILTTYSCNFHCTYCSAGSVKEEVFLDEDTSAAVVHWITEQAEKKKCRRISLAYCGGEPLLNVRPVYNISWEVREWADRHEVGFDFSIVTNGSLINPGLIDKFLSVGLREVRISIDGARDEHDKKRPFYDGRATFDCILENIRSVIDKVDIGITGNIDSGNIGTIPELLDCLEKENVLCKLNKIEFVPLPSRADMKINPGAFGQKQCIPFFDRGGITKELLSIEKELSRRGERVGPVLTVQPCPLFTGNAPVIIDPYGRIYNCAAFTGRPEFSSGDVYGNMSGSKRKSVTGDARRRCPDDCTYFPLCGGGCPFLSYVMTGTLHDVFCRREYFDEIMPELIKGEYERMKEGERSGSACVPTGDGT